MCRSITIVARKEGQVEKEQKSRIGKTAFLIEEVTAESQSMQQPKEKGKQFKVLRSHPQQPWATRA